MKTAIKNGLNWSAQRKVDGSSEATALTVALPDLNSVKTQRQQNKSIKHVSIQGS